MRPNVILFGSLGDRDNNPDKTSCENSEEKMAVFVVCSIVFGLDDMALCTAMNDL